MRVQPMTGSPAQPDHQSWRARLFTIIFEADTPAGKVFDVVLLWSILLSVVVVSLESVAAIRAEHGRLLLALEWFFTLLFTAEYVVRLLCVRKPAKYASSFYGIVDLLAIVPTYLSVIFFGKPVPAGDPLPQAPANLSGAQADPIPG